MTEETKETEDRKIKYVKHPLDPAEKKKLRRAGFTIIDERFDPNYKRPTKAAEQPQAKAAIPLQA